MVRWRVIADAGPIHCSMTSVWAVISGWTRSIWFWTASVNLLSVCLVLNGCVVGLVEVDYHLPPACFAAL